MKWFRFYDEVLDDPKCQRLSPAMFRHWVNILCIANRSNVRGVLPAISDVAFSLRVSPAKAKTILTDLVATELLDLNADGSYSPHGWKSRQRVSDDVAQRVAKHRTETVTETEKKDQSNVTCNVTETFPRARATEAETEAETEVGDKSPTPPAREKPTRPDYSVEFESFWQTYPSGHGVKKATYQHWKRIKPDPELAATITNAIDGWRKSDKWQRGFIMDAENFLKNAAWESIPPPQSAGKVTHLAAPAQRSSNGYVNGFDEVIAEYEGRHPPQPLTDDDDAIETHGRLVS